MDSLSPEARSRVMSAIRGANTRPELLLRSALFARGLRFRVNAPDLPGRPDIKLTRYRAVVLVHGCFWHGHHCSRFRLPSSNRAFWAAKITRNRERDLRDLGRLREAGWRVCVVWECALRGHAFKTEGKRLVDSLESWIRGKKPFLELFDQASVDPQMTSARPRKPIGRNSDEGLFAAERTQPFGTSPSGRLEGPRPRPPRRGLSAKKPASPH